MGGNTCGGVVDDIPVIELRPGDSRRDAYQTLSMGIVTLNRSRRSSCNCESGRAETKSLEAGKNPAHMFICIESCWSW